MRTFETIKYPLNEQELRELGDALARETAGVIDLEKKKTARAAEISAQIKQANRRCAELAAKINSRFEMRQMEVLVLFDTPRVGMKRVVSALTSEVLYESEMTAAERQRTFGFTDPDEPSES